MDKVTLFNQALHKLGDREYVRDSPSGKECDLWFPEVYHRALTFGAWSFALKEKEIQPITLEATDYAIPVDSLRLIKVDALRFRIIGDVIRIQKHHQRHEQGKELFIRYISNDLAKREVLPENEPLFSEGVMLLLASKIAMKLSSNPSLAVGLEQEANIKFKEALHRNALQEHSNDQHPLKRILDMHIF